MESAQAQTTNFCSTYNIDACADGAVYGDEQGIARVEQLEQELDSMTIRADHPRLFITQETLPIYQQRVRDGHPSWNNVKNLANQGDMVNMAFAYLMW